MQPDARTTAGERRRRLGACLALAAVALWCVVAAFFAVGGADEALRTVWIDVALVALDLLAASAAVLAGRSEHLERRTRLGWQLVGLAFAFRAAADGLWWWLEVVQGQQPFPSLADLFYVLFVPALLAALLTFPVRRRSRGEQQRLWLDIAIVLVGAFMVVWYLVLGPTARGADTSLATLLSIAYPIGDLVLVFGLAALFVRGVGSLARRPLYLLMLGVCSFVAADLGFAAASLGDGFTTGSWPDFAFLGASALVALAAAAQLRTGAVPARPPRAVRDTMPLLANPLPYLGVALGYGLLVWVGRNESPYGLGGLLLSAVLITVLVLARQITVTRDNERLARRFEEIAVTDALTGLANRRRLLEAAEQAVAAADGDGRDVALVVIDVDRFKEVNDTLGHLAGDVVIRVVAARIRAAVRPDDLAARYGGDEFVVLMPGLGGDGALAVTRRLAAAVCAEPVHTPAGPVRVTLSIGVAHVAGTPQADALGRVEQLLTRADNALYEVKRRGRDGVHLATV